MKAALFFFVVVAAAALAQASDYNGVVTAEKAVPANFVSMTSCLVTAVGEVFTSITKTIVVCLSEPLMIPQCIAGIAPTLIDDVSLAYNDCMGNI